MSPELLDPKSLNLNKAHPTMESDRYALGMVVYEIFSRQTPFKEHGYFVAIVLNILGGERPKRPQGDGGNLFTHEIWSMVELCWKHNPGDRASAKDVLRCLGGTSSRPSSPSSDDYGEPDLDD
jgi:hypothetical protein